MPEEWQAGLVFPIWKRKGDVQDPGKYRGITLLSHTMKLLERILDGRIRKGVEQEGTTDGMFALKQLGEKRLEMQWRMAVIFVNPEKAYDTITGYMVTATVRWMGVPEAEARMVKAMHEIIKGRVVVV